MIIQSPLLCLAGAAGGTALSLDGGAKSGAVVVIDPMRKVKVDSNILKTLYNITPAEIDLVNAMANGIKPVQYAAQVNKSVPTIQSQRQAVFQKIGVSSQLGLMSILRDLTTSFEAMTDLA